MESPVFPKRAVITAGMPYGNKPLHFGHIAGVFVPADFYARFLRDRIGSENVLFVSGTDCYGSPILEGARKSVGTSQEALESYVSKNHEAQRQVLRDFSISLNYFGGSALKPAKKIHQDLTNKILKRLFELDWLEKRETLQFYDEEVDMYLNGRQVEGRCPVRGCKSEKAYADECDMGHQFDPKELIHPISQLTQTTPTLKSVSNWYFALDRFMSYLENVERLWEKDPQVRSLVTQTMQESLVKPRLFIKNELEDTYREIAQTIPKHSYNAPQGQQQSFSLTFHSWHERDKAEAILEKYAIRFRAGKCLLPLRITGNVSWGVSAETLPHSHDLTVWVWPESLWAPISFTICALSKQKEISEQNDELFSANVLTCTTWADWWTDDCAKVFQFIGQDNIYFYCLAQPALFKALNWNFSLNTPIANYHVLFLNKKASSSGAIKPPLAHELLNHYTAEQLRCHWLSLGLDSKSISFSPKPFDTTVSFTDKKTGEAILTKDNVRVADPVLKESAFLTNIFNRLARSCFYGAQKYLDTKLPTSPGDIETLAACKTATKQFEQAMCELNFHKALTIAEEFGRAAHKAWDSASKTAKDDSKIMKRALSNAFSSLRTLTLLMHAATPQATEAIVKQMNISPQLFFSWDYANETLQELVKREGGNPNSHELKPLPPKTDFFKKHKNQYAQ